MNDMDLKNLKSAICLVCVAFAAIAILFLANRLSFKEAATAFLCMVAAMILGEFIFWSVTQRGKK